MTARRPGIAISKTKNLLLLAAIAGFKKLQKWNKTQGMHPAQTERANNQITLK
jgi:hypothetical protein